MKLAVRSTGAHPWLRAHILLAVAATVFATTALPAPVVFLSCLSWKWKERPSVKITERTTCEKSESTILRKRRLPS